MRIIEKTITAGEIKKDAEKFHDMVKAVVDIEKEIMAIDAELHSDLEAFLLEGGSKQKHLWGINIYPSMIGTDDFVEFDSLINVRPSHGNKTRGIDDGKTREKILAIVLKKVQK